VPGRANTPDRRMESPAYSPRPGSYSLPLNGLWYSAGDPT